MRVLLSKSWQVPSYLTLAKMLLVGSIALAVLSVTLGVYFFTTQGVAPAQSHAAISSAAQVKSPPTASTSQYPAMVAALGKQYMNALLQQHYDVMWSLLHPQMQAMWPNETAFATYWKTRFQDFKLQGFTLGTASPLASWVNPETMARYDQVEALPISLQLVPQAPANQVSTLPISDQHASQLFQNLPLIALRSTSGNKTQWQIVSGGPADLEAPILPPATTVAKTAKVPILMYHYISDVPANDPNKPLRASLSVNPTLFGQQMDYLKSRGYQTITFNQLFDALYYDGPLPAKPIILTFDDGYEDSYTAAFPILKAHNYSGMFYIVTGKVGWQGQMTWDQLREMSASGMQMGSHTIHHVDIGSVLQESHDQAEQEVNISQLDLQKHLGIPIQQFCYPSGEPFKHGSTALRQAAMTLLSQNGYVGATTDPGMTGSMQNSQTPLALLRIRVDGRIPLQTFMMNEHSW